MAVPTCRAWCEAQWSKQVLRRVLAPLYTATDMQGWNRAECLRRIYLYDQADLFAEQSAVGGALSIWDKARGQYLRPKVLSLTTMHKAALEWLRSRLTPGRIFALAEDCYEVIEYSGGTQALPPAPGFEEVCALLGSDEVLATRPDVEHAVVFKVVNDNLGGRVLAGHPWHMGGRPLAIGVVVYKAGSTSLSTTVFGSGDHACLDLLRLAASDRFPGVLQSLSRFQKIAARGVLDLHPSAAALLALEAAPLPALPSHAEQSERRVSAAPAELSQALLAIGRRAFGGEAPLLALGNATAEVGAGEEQVAKRLVERGVLASSLREGTSIVRPRPEDFLWRPEVQASRPLLELAAFPRAVSPAALPRLDLIAVLLRQGFVFGDKVGTCYEDGGASTASASMARNGTKLYLACLYDRATIFGKGASTIHHAGKAPYYKALLTSADTRRVEELMDQGLFKEVQKIADANTLEDAEDGPLAVEDQPEEESVGVEESPPMPMLVFDDEEKDSVDIDPYTAELPGTGLNVSVHFMWSGKKNKNLRAFARCPVKEHGRCYKYQHVNVSGSREGAIAFLVAWARAAPLYPPPTVGPSEHQGATPDEADVQEALAEVRQQA